MAEQFTPGPWRIGFSDGSGSGSDREGAWITTVAPTLPDHVIVAGCDHDGVPCGVRTEANGRLIAAAPELYQMVVSLAVRLDPGNEMRQNAVALLRRIDRGDR